MKVFEYPLSLGKGLTLRPVERMDIEATHLLNLGRPVPRDLYLWLYFDNPFRHDRPTGFVVVHEKHGVTGKIWLIWWPTRFRREPVICVSGGDLYVDGRLRGMGAGKALVQHQFECFPQGFVLGSSANVNSMSFWRKFGGFTVGLGNVRWQRALSPLAALRVFAAAVPPLRRGLRRVLTAPSTGQVRPPEAGRGWRTPDFGDPHLLAFLERSEAWADVVTHRDETFLRWRYERARGEQPRLLVTEGPGGINGFLAMQVRTREARLGLRVAEVIDYAVDFEAREACDALLAAAVDWGRTCRAHVVEWRGTHPALPRLFKGRRWLRRQSEINPFVCYSAQTKELDLASRAFHMVVGDGDAGFR